VEVQALVDRPDEVRRIINFKRLVLTDFKIDIPRLAKKKVLSAALEESGEYLCPWQRDPRNFAVCLLSSLMQRAAFLHLSVLDIPSSSVR
jgi:hypothetical protein